MSKTGKARSRVANVSASARVIIADITSTTEAPSSSSSSSSSFVEALATSLHQFLMLHSSLPGSPKIQLFSLYALANNTFKEFFSQCAIPMLHTRMNFQKILNSVADLPTLLRMQKDGNEIKETFEDMLEAIIFDSMNQHQQANKSCSSSASAKNASIGTQVNFCFITNQHRTNVEKTIAKIMKDNAHIKSIKKVQVVRINCSESNRDLQISQESSGSTDSGITEVVCGYMESLYLENHVWSFDQFFRKWLQDTGTDDVHLYIEFEDFSLKCDLMDTIIDPINVSGAQNFLLETDVTFRMPYPPSVKNRQKSSVNIYTLVPQKFIRVDGICESVLYGMSLIAKPTTCWKLDWEELERNQSYFQSVNSYLAEKGFGLLMSIQEHGLVHSHFLMLPSSGSTMLIKSIATQDLLMPRDVCSNESTVKDYEVYATVSVVLDKMSVMKEYNPFQHTCHLFSSISNHKSQGKVPTTPTTTFKDSCQKPRPNPFLSSYQQGHRVALKPLHSNQGNFKRPPKKMSMKVTEDDINVTCLGVGDDSTFSTTSDWGRQRKKSRFEPPRTVLKN